MNVRKFQSKIAMYKHRIKQNQKHYWETLNDLYVFRIINDLARIKDMEWRKDHS